MNYKSSGVDIEAGDAFVDRLKTRLPSIGGFNGMFQIPPEYEEPVLVSGADGVGTKINICRIAFDYTTIGQDLVAMCVNDVICCGAKPLYFLDYISTKKLDGNVDDIISGIIKGCEISDMQLLGGETAEHGRFASGYDLGGFCTGIVEKRDIVNGSNIRPGDKIIGIESNGLHSNGYSLINDMLWRNYITYKDIPELLEPTTIYSPLIQSLLDEIPILGMAHITGGGIPGNLPRCLPEGLTAEVDYWSWPRPELFNRIEKAGNIEEKEMRKVFNLGVGFCLIVPQETVIDRVQTLISEPPFGTRSWVIGVIK